MPPARISLTISRHFSLSFIASGRSSGLHPVSSHSCCMYVRAGRPAFAWPYVGVHSSTSLTSSSLLLQQCPACLARLTCIVFVMGGRWPYSWRLVGCCRPDLFNIALNNPMVWEKENNKKKGNFYFLIQGHHLQKSFVKKVFLFVYLCKNCVYIYIYIYILYRVIGIIECFPKARKAVIQLQFKSYQRLKNDTWCLLA